MTETNTVKLEELKIAFTTTSEKTRAQVAAAAAATPGPSAHHEATTSWGRKKRTRQIRIHAINETRNWWCKERTCPATQITAHCHLSDWPSKPCIHAKSPGYKPTRKRSDPFAVQNGRRTDQITRSQLERRIWRTSLLHESGDVINSEHHFRRITSPDFRGASLFISVFQTFYLPIYSSSPLSSPKNIRFPIVHNSIVITMSSTKPDMNRRVTGEELQVDPNVSENSSLYDDDEKQLVVSPQRKQAATITLPPS